MNIYMRFPEGAAKVLTLSYDDGNLADFKLVEILNKYGLKCTFNLNSCNYKSAEGLEYFKKLICTYEEDGHELAVHGEHHAFMEQQPTALAVREILNDREFFEKETGKIVRGMAYPYGTWNEEMFLALNAAGIAYSRTTNATHDFAMPKNWLALNPTCKHTDEKLFELLEKFLSINDDWRQSMFYLWGHSFEFENDKNWDLIEKFAQKASGHSDIWYATNIEIYEYIKAYKSLVFSADASFVQNPTATDVWFLRQMSKYPVTGEKLIKVPAGQCVKVI